MQLTIQIPLDLKNTIIALLNKHKMVSSIETTDTTNQLTINLAEEFKNITAPELFKYISDKEQGFAYKILDSALKEYSSESQEYFLELISTSKINYSIPNFYPNSHCMPSERSLDILFSTSLRPQKVLQIIINHFINHKNIHKITTINKIENLIKKTIKLGATIDAAHIDRIDHSQIPHLFDLGLSTKKFSKHIVNKAVDLSKNRTPVSNELIIEFENLTNLALAKEIDLSNVFEKNLEHIPPEIHRGNNIDIPCFVNNETLKKLQKKGLVNANILLKYAITNDDLEFLKDSIKLGAKIENLLDDAIKSKDLICAKYLIEELKQSALNHYIASLSEIFSSDIERKISLINLVHNIIDKEKYTKELQQEYSIITPHAITTIEEVLEVLVASANNSDELSIIEKNIFKSSDISASSFQEVKTTNKWGYSPLHLAIIAGNYKLATELLQNGHDLYQKSNNETTALELLFYTKKTNDDSFIDTLITKLNNVESINITGRSIADYLIELSKPKLTKKVIELSNDPLFLLEKEEVVSDKILQDNKVHIGILYDNQCSNGLNLFTITRALSKKYPNVVFHKIIPTMLEQCSESFLNKFDGFIQPGGRRSDELGKLSKLIIDHSEETKTPFMGICAGLSYLAHQKKIESVKVSGYSHGQHEIRSSNHVFSYMLSSSQEQQRIENKEGYRKPIAPFKGVTMHHSAIDSKKLSPEELGAVSKGGVTMAYTSKTSSGLVMGVQFHPESAYFQTTEDAIPQQHLFHSFVRLAEKHKEVGVNLTGFLDRIITNSSNMPTEPETTFTGDPDPTLTVDPLFS